MKISIIVGGRFHAFNLAEELDSKGFLNQLITSYPKYYIKNNFNINIQKVDTIILKEILSRIPLTQKFFENFVSNYFEKKASKLIDIKNIDILIGWSGFSLSSFEKAKNFNCIKVLERGSTHIEFQRDILLKEYRLMNLKPKLPSREIIKKELKEYELADYITVPSEFAKKTFLEKGLPKHKIIKIPYGVNIKQFDIVNEKKIKKNLFRVIYVGNCSVRKGIIYLLKVFEELNLKNSELMIVGNIDTEIRPILSKYLRSKKVNYLKSKNQNELYKFYNISDVFVTCTIEEGLSMVQLQAMACGLPIICTQNSGGEDIVKDGYDGFIIPVRDTIELKKKIKFFYNNPHICKKMGKNARIKSKNYLTWKDYGEKVISNYNKILKKKIK